jgi:ABC-type antimicrobial peptide transport system permease subunit
VDPGLPMFHLRTMREQATTRFAEQRFLQQVLLIAALLATLLSAGGVYGLVSYATQRATHEFGIRMALGAQGRNIIWIVLRRGIVLSFFGVGIGVAAALALSRLLASLLYGVAPTDPITFAGVALLIVIVTLASCYLPARRATQVDPLVALRTE